MDEWWMLEKSINFLLSKHIHHFIVLHLVFVIQWKMQYFLLEILQVALILVVPNSSAKAKMESGRKGEISYSLTSQVQPQIEFEPLLSAVGSGRPCRAECHPAAPSQQPRPHRHVWKFYRPAESQSCGGPRRHRAVGAGGVRLHHL